MQVYQNENENITKKDVNDNLEGLNRLLLGLNAYGSLELMDYKLITDYLRSSFDYKFIDDDD